MPRTPQPLPQTLPAVFTAREATSTGVPRRRLAHADVSRLAHGIYARRSTLDSSERQPYEAQAALHPASQWSVEQRDRAKALASRLLPGRYFSHHTAAALWRLPVTPPRSAPALLDVAAARPAHGKLQLGVRTHTLAPAQSTVVQLGHVPLADAATTWALVAPTLGQHDAVALGDATIWRPRYPGTSRLKRSALATIEDLERAASVPYRRGGRALRELLPMLSTQSASPPESHLRLRLAEWHAPPPTLDHDVVGQHGELLGCSEITFPEYRIALEYEGRHHFTLAKQLARDIEKYQRYAEHGWLVLRVTSKLLYRQPRELRRQVLTALRQRGWEGSPSPPG